MGAGVTGHNPGVSSAGGTPAPGQCVKVGGGWGMKNNGKRMRNKARRGCGERKAAAGLTWARPGRAGLGAAQGARASRRSWAPAACSSSWRLLKSWIARLFWKSMRAMVMEAFQQLWSGHRKSISLRSLVTMVK